MKQGFMLIEVLLSTAIGAVLMMLLLASLDQINRLSLWSNDMMDRTIVGFSDCHQLERDLSGVFIPSYVNKNHALFECSVSEKNRLARLTFVTTNTLFVHSGCNPRIVRVMYRLIEDKKHKKESGRTTYLLMRQESENLDPQVFDKKNSTIRPYVVARLVRTCTVSLIKIKKDEQGKQTIEEKAEWPEKKEGKKEVVAAEDKKQAKETDEELQLPTLVTFTIELDDVKGKRPVRFSTSVVLIAPEEKPKSAQQLPAPAQTEQEKSNPAEKAEKAEKSVSAAQGSSVVPGLSENKIAMDTSKITLSFLKGMNLNITTVAHNGAK